MEDGVFICLSTVFNSTHIANSSVMCTALARVVWSWELRGRRVAEVWPGPNHPVVPESAGQQWQQRVSELQEVTRGSLSEG